MVNESKSEEGARPYGGSIGHRLAVAWKTSRQWLTRKSA